MEQTKGDMQKEIKRWIGREDKITKEDKVEDR